MGRERCIVLAQCAQRLLRAATGLIDAFGCGGARLAELGDADAYLGEALLGGVSLGSELEPGAVGTGCCAQRLRGDDLSARGDDGHRVVVQRIQCRANALRGTQVVRDEHVREDAEDPVRRGDHVDRRRRPVDLRQLRWPADSVGDHEIDDAALVRRGFASHGERGLRVIDEHPLGEGTENRRDGGFETGGDLHRIADEPADAGRTRFNDFCSAAGQR